MPVTMPSRRYSGSREVRRASEPDLDARVDLLGKGVDDRADERRGDGE